jgi:hypothetical protein
MFETMECFGLNEGFRLTRRCWEMGMGMAMGMAMGVAMGVAMVVGCWPSVVVATVVEGRRQGEKGEGEIY